ncbi:MAG TPA: BON domain-containing protein [Opitutaceae bacterium]|nr:BON domain-containing protein [Opitutaceae bacterium]
MKTKLNILTAVLAATVAVGALLGGGCAATATRESTGEYIDNSAITARVKTALASDQMVKAREVHVETFRGSVQLSGFVSTDAEKERAAQLAAGIPGVREVKNNIIVKTQ